MPAGGRWDLIRRLTNESYKELQQGNIGAEDRA